MNITPPQNIDAEKEFIGACIIDPTILDNCIIRQEYFYSDRHKSIYKAMQKLYRSDHDISPISIQSELKETSAMPFVELVSFAQMAGLWKVNQKLIIDAWKMRRILNLGHTLMQHVVEKTSFDEIYTHVMDSMEGISTGSDIDISPYYDVINAGYKHIEDRHGKGSIAGVPTGISLLDEITDGLQDDEFTIIAARPAVGKTALVQGIVNYAASKNYPCGWINLEMSNRQLGLRALSSATKIPLTMLKKAAIAEDDWESLQIAADSLSSLPIYVADSAFTDRKIAQVMYRMVREKKCKLLVLDYIQLMEKENDEKNKNTSREREVASFSRLMKMTAKNLHVPVIALAQINRASENTKDKRPAIHNLRESGAIEADADRILLLHNPECSCGEALMCSCGNRNAIEVIIGKGRNDPTGSIMVEWHKATTTFGRSYRPGEFLPQESNERNRYE